MTFVISSCVCESEWAKLYNRVDCAFCQLHCSTSTCSYFPLTVGTDAGAASFPRFSQTRKNVFDWIYSTRGPRFYRSNSAAGGTQRQTTEVLGFYCGCARYVHTFKKTFISKEISLSTDSDNRKKTLNIGSDYRATPKHIKGFMLCFVF